ncbi:MAG: helix-turn-helix transcriptional regulator [Bauldia sp.]
MGRSTAARAATRIKQLCCLGVGREAVMPAIFDELNRLLPSVSMLAFFLDGKQKLAGGYTNNPEAATTGPLYLSEFHGRRGRELGGAFPDNVRTQIGVQDYADALGAIDVDQPTFDRSDFYNLIYRPQRIYWFTRLLVREGGNGRAVGSLTLYRGLKERPWLEAERRRLASLEPFFVQALAHTGESGEPLADSGRSGVVVADATGKLVSWSLEGRRLLDLATHPVVTDQTDFSRWGTLPPPLVRICRNLVRVFGDDPSAPAPVHYHRNPWGGFLFRAEWLKGAGPAMDRISIAVTHREPLRLALTRRVGDLNLSRRQSEVCVLLANGASNEAIGERLGISRHTAIAHGRWIYDKLDVHNRAELVNRLLAPGAIH